VEVPNESGVAHQVPVPRQPHLVIVDSKLELPLNAKLLSTLGQHGQASSVFSQETVDAIAPRQIYVYYAVDNPAKREAFEKLGVTLVHMPEASPGHGEGQAVNAKVDLQAMMRDLAQVREINELHVEAGYKLNGSLLRAGVVDELLIYLAPKLLGPGLQLANLNALPSLQDLPASQQLQFTDVQLIGARSEQNAQKDLQIIARLQDRDRF
jgi:diaminohydroxyphosphoribosylaminopyrimidine deaminase / 5-amino-6-(5-phosphoribosylamino)uracil reductase